MRWWRLPIEERACRNTHLGGGDYSLRNSGLPPSLNFYFIFKTPMISQGIEWGPAILDEREIKDLNLKIKRAKFLENLSTTF